MALSAHLTAVQCGLALMIFGLVWPFLALGESLLYVTAYAVIAGYFLIWGGITLAAITGASKALPIAGEGFRGSIYSEVTVKIMVRSGSLLSLIAGALMVGGFWRAIV